MTEFFEVPQRPHRKPGRALRFAEIKVGDQLVLGPSAGWWRQIPWYYVVTDLWFDPVRGQDDETAGRMVAIARIGPTGEIQGHKTPHTLRGLASNGYRYADKDAIAIGRAFAAGVASGEVIGIGYGQTVRRRPKIPSRNL
jgi:hypothetical protein